MQFKNLLDREGGQSSTIFVVCLTVNQMINQSGDGIEELSHDQGENK